MKLTSPPLGLLPQKDDARLALDQIGALRCGVTAVHIPAITGRSRRNALDLGGAGWHIGRMPMLAALRLAFLVFALLPWGAYAQSRFAALPDLLLATAEPAQTRAEAITTGAELRAAPHRCRTALPGSACNPLPALPAADMALPSRALRGAQHPDVTGPAGTLRVSRIFHPPRSA